MYDEITGLPNNKSYLECGLPEWLKKSINKMAEIWEQLDRGEENYRWDCYKFVAKTHRLACGMKATFI